MNKNKLEETKNQSQTNKGSSTNNATINSSMSGATLKTKDLSGNESDDHNLLNSTSNYNMSNEQAINSKGASNADLSNKTSNISYASLEEVEKFNAREAAIRDTDKK